MADKLLCYRLQVLNKRDSEYKDLFCFDDTHDLLSDLHNWINELHADKYENSSNARVILRASDDVLDIEDRLILGQITTGRTGSGSKILTSAGKLKADKLHTDLDTVKLFFSIYIPQTGRDGVIFCQDHDGLNPFQCLRGYLNMKFSRFYHNYKLCISPIVFAEIIDRFLKDGQIISLELKKRMENTDEIDKVNPDKNRFKNPFVTYVITPDREAKHLKQTIKGDLRKIYDQGGKKCYLDIEFDNAKMTLEVGEKTRKFNLENIYSRANVWPLNDEIELDTNRIPMYKSVRLEALELLKGLIN